MDQRQDRGFIRRWREIRDVYDKLRKKYRADVVEDFIIKNYFVNRVSMYKSMKDVDKLPVDIAEASLIYKAVMRDDFTL